ncbi:MAG: hypothetical protein KKD39_02985 [Candidatus Altiarchaeota archaeon]|nr:hypothetical protein [Candidatus Altiarchaeota archaeon]
MQKKAVESIRKATIITNGVWPFKTLNRLPYTLAMELFKRLCRRFPEIKAAYLRHSQALGGWTPGLSDIDYTVIIHEGLSAKQEYLFHEKFLKDYVRLKTYLPMSGEVEVMTVGEFGLWSKHGLRGRMSNRWRLIHGQDVRCNGCHSQEPPLNELLEEAFGLYEGYLVPKLAGRRSWLLDLEIERLSGKICGILGHQSRTNSVKEVIAALDMSCRKFIGENQTLQEPAKYDVRLHEMPVKECIRGIQDALAAMDEVRDAIYVGLSESAGIMLVIVEKPTTSDIIFEKFQNKYLIILTESMLEYYFRFHHPEMFPYLSCRAESMNGNSLSPKTPPSYNALKDSQIFNAVRSSVLYRSYITAERVDENPHYLLSYTSTLNYLRTGTLIVGDLEEIAFEGDKITYDEYVRLYKSSSEDSFGRYNLIKQVVEEVLHEIGSKTCGG